MEFKFVILPVVVGLLIPSIAVPWTIINLFGYHSFSPFNVLDEILGQTKSKQQMYLVDLTNPFKDAYTGIIISTILFIISIPSVIAAIVRRKNRPIFTLVVGILCISSGLIWLYSIDSFRSNFAKIAASTGGLIAGEWKGAESVIANRIIILGMGQYFVISAGILSMIAWGIPKIQSLDKLKSGALLK
jgi:hypothetical protein